MDRFFFNAGDVEEVLNVANVQVLPVSISNFQLGEGGGMCEWVSDGVKSEARLTIGNIGIGNIITLATFNRSTVKRYHKALCKKVRSGECFAAYLLFFPCTGFGRIVRRVTFRMFLAIWD